MSFPLFLLAGFLFSPAHATPHENFPYRLIQGCALDDKGIQCWNKAHFDLPAPIGDPFELQGDEVFACMQDKQGIHCSDWDGRNIRPIPQFREVPRSLSVSTFYSCAIDGGEVKCWGSDYERYTQPTFRNARLVVVYDNIACALDDEGAKCWGEYWWRWNAVPPLKNPTALSVNHDGACAIDEGEVKCWGDPQTEISPPRFKNPRMIQSQWHSHCVLDDEGVKCWGSRENVVVPPLVKPTYLQSSYDSYCAFTVEGWVCWGREVKIPPLNLSTPHASEPEKLSQYFSHLSEISYPVRSSFFVSLAAAIRSSPTESERESRAKGEFALALASPAILKADSSVFEKKIIPIFSRYAGDFEKQKAVLAKTPSSTESRKLALYVVRASLDLAAQFFPENSRRSVDEIVALTDKAIQGGASAPQMRAVLKGVESVNKEFESLKLSPKAGFLAEVMELCAGWLRKAK